MEVKKAHRGVQVASGLDLRFILILKLNLILGFRLVPKFGRFGTGPQSSMIVTVTLGHKKFYFLMELILLGD